MSKKTRREKEAKKARKKAKRELKEIRRGDRPGDLDAAERKLRNAEIEESQALQFGSGAGVGRSCKRSDE